MILDGYHWHNYIPLKLIIILVYSRVTKENWYTMSVSVLQETVTPFETIALNVMLLFCKRCYSELLSALKYGSKILPLKIWCMSFYIKFHDNVNKNV